MVTHGWHFLQKYITHNSDLVTKVNDKKAYKEAKKVKQEINTTVVRITMVY